MVKPVLIFCLLLTFIGAVAQKVRPLLHLTLGQTYYLQNKATSRAVRTIGGRENQVTTAISFKIAFKVIRATDTVYDLEARYLSLSMKIRLADTTLTMNSETNNKADTPSTIMAKIVNKPFSVKMLTRGNIKNIEGADQLIASAFGDFPSIDSLKKQKVASQFAQAFGEAAVKGLLEMGIAVFPGHPVAVNDRWDQNSTTFSPTQAAVHTFYSLVNITPDFYIVQAEGSISADKDAKPVELNGVPVKYSLNGSLMNDIKIDKRSGWISEFHFRQTTEENMEIPDSPKTPGGMSIPMMFTTEMTVSSN